MKRIAKRILVFILALVLCTGSFVGCAAKGKTLLELDGERMSVNMFQLLLSRMKGTCASAYGFGEEALSDSFWDKILSSDGTTYNDHYTAQVLDNAKTYLAALYLFEQEGLELPKSYIEDIDAEIERLINDDADGSKATFNSILAQYGVNYKMLREAYIMEAKISYLRDYLFGTDGSKISAELTEEYYQKNYARFKQVFIYTYAIKYETDEFGNDIYYDAADSTRISYDASAKAKTDESGKQKKDKNGDVIRVTDDGKIAYDKKNGKRNPILGEDGYPETRKYTEEEYKAASDRAQIIFESCEKNDSKLFDLLVEEYSEDEGMIKYTNGYYITEDSNYDSKEVVEAVFDMEVGEVRQVVSDYGIHIVMRYELDKGGYAKKDNSDFFISTETGKYNFMSDMLNDIFSEHLQQYVDRIVVNEELLALVDMKRVGANFYY